VGGTKDRQANQDLWHLTIDDLLTPPAETPRLGGDGPFIINLSTSTAPIVIPPKDQLNIEGLHAYQISRTEDGRQRFRLRLGPISTELEADALLSALRDRYPGAMIATAADDDLRAIGSANRVAKATKQAKPVSRSATSSATSSAERKAVALPPEPAAAAHDDANEITGSGWDLDSLLPHLSGPAATPKPKAAAAKAAPVAKKVAPPAPKAKPPATAKAPVPPPAANPPAAVRPSPPPPAPTPTAKAPAHSPVVQAPAVAKTVAAPPVLTKPVVPGMRAKAGPTPPILTAAVEPKPAGARTDGSTAPSSTRVASPAPAGPTVQIAPPAPPVAQIAPAVVAEVPPPPAVEIASRPAAVVVATPAVEVAAPPLTKSRANVPVQASPNPKAPPADPLETDWASILSAPVEDTASRPIFQVPVEPPPSFAPTPPAATTTRASEPGSRASDDSGLQKLVDKSNALVNELETRSDAVPADDPAVLSAAELFAAAAAVEAVEVAKVAETAKVVEGVKAVEVAPVMVAPPTVVAEDPSAVIFSPLNTQSIEQKLAKLAEILHGGEHADSTAGPPSTHAAPTADAPAQVEWVPVDDIELFFDDDTPLRPSTAVGTWPLVERRQESRPELKSPAAVVTSIEDMVVVDEANNLDDLVAKEVTKAREPAIDPTAETDRVPVLKAPSEDVEVDLSVDVSAEVAPAQAQPATPPIQTPAVDASASARAIALVLESDLSLEPELTLAPSEEAPPPVLIEDLIVSGDLKDPSLKLLVEKDDWLIEAQETPPQATAPTPPPVARPVEAPVELKLAEPAIVVVSTVVLEKPAPKPHGDEPHVSTIVLEPAVAAAAASPPSDAAKAPQAAPVVIRTRESAADTEAKNATHLSARAAARAAKKLRVAKHAAKLAALTAARNSGAAAVKPQPGLPTPAKVHTRDVAPAAAQPAAASTPGPAPKSEAPAPKAAAPAARPAPVLSRKPSQKPQPTPSKPPAAPAKAAQPPASRPAMSPAAQKPAHAPAASANGSHAAAAPERKVTIRTEHTPSIDSTQTMRALTPLELADDQISKWFVIQLAVSEDDFDPDQIPHLDIFEAYRLYAVIGLDQGKILHALRLGFFSDEISASAVTSYVKTHFDGASVKRVSVAERERFAESQVSARKDIGATGMHAIIEMASPKPVPETRLADLAGGSGQRPSEEKSLWSRLVSPLKRP